MTCPRCQSPNPEGARFCEECGVPLELRCPSCGETVGTGKKFCRSCGGALAMYREMDMRFWLEQAETELMELGA